MECDWTFSCLPLHVHFRWGVTLVGKFSTGHCLPRRGTPFQVQGDVQGDDALTRL